MEPIVQTKNLAVGYNDEILLKDIRLKLHRGEITALIGPNGSGKSTILKTITGNLKEIAGVTYINKDSIKELSGRELAKTMAVVWTKRVKPELMTGWDVVAAGRYPYTGKFGILSGRDKEAVERAMTLSGVMDLAECDFNTLSDGQKQRLMLARAICQETPVLILDEPTSFLDIRYKVELLHLLKKLAGKNQVAVLLSIHEVELVEKVADYVVGVKDNGVFCQGKPREILQETMIRALYDLDEEQYRFWFQRTW